MNKFIREFMLVIFLLTACQSTSTANVLPTNIPPTSMLLSPTLSKPTQDVASKTPESIVSSSPIAVPVVIPNDQGVIELPDWIKDPENNLILFTYHDSQERSSKIGFFNPKDGEQVIVQLPNEIYQCYWKDSNHIVFLQGYCNETPENITELDISQGTLRPSNEKEYPESIQACYPSLNINKKETIKIDTYSPEPTVEIFDSSSSKWLRLTDPSDDISDIGYEVSPYQDYLAVVQTKGKYTFPELWRPLFGTQVSIYHLPDRKLLATFPEEQEISNILSFTSNEDVIYVRGDTLCVIMILSLFKKCIHNISNQFSGSTIILGDRLKNPKQLSFMYFTFEPHHGGFCFYDLFSGEIDCPTDHFDRLKDQVSINYALSPDENYLLIEYDYKGCPAPWCDYAGDPQLAVINIKTNQFFEIGSSMVFQALDIFRSGQPWRPMP